MVRVFGAFVLARHLDTDSGRYDPSRRDYECLTLHKHGQGTQVAKAVLYRADHRPLLLLTSQRLDLSSIAAPAGSPVVCLV